MIEISSSNQYPQIRIVLREGLDERAIVEARRERESLKRWLYCRRPEVIAKQRAYGIEYRAQPGRLEKRRAQKRRWREENRALFNAYFRRYDKLTPGRKEYKARWAREKRARDRAAKKAQ